MKKIDLSKTVYELVKKYPEAQGSPERVGLL